MWCTGTGRRVSAYARRVPFGPPQRCWRHRHRERPVAIERGACPGFRPGLPRVEREGFTVFVVRHGSRPRYPLSSVVADMRRSVRFIHQHAKEHVDPNRIGVFGNSSGGHLALLLGRPATRGIRRPPTPCSGNPVASRRSWRTIRGRIWLDWRCSTRSSTLPRPKRQSSLRFVSSLPDQLPRS